jgi:hypothetical protein
VPDFVRDQLFTDDQKDEMTVSLRQIMKLWRTISTPFDAFVNYTGLDWADNDRVCDVLVKLREGMFDLMLGDRTRRVLLNQYEEVHVIRERFEDFISARESYLEPRCTDVSLWWDTFDVDSSPRKQWVSKGLAGDGDFLDLVVGWLEDEKKLQDWLNDYEEKATLANNPAQESERVFSETAAIEIMRFAKVGMNSCTGNSGSDIRFRHREGRSTSSGRQSIRQSLSVSGTNARVLVCFGRGCPGSLRCSSTSLRSGR